jgi:hypothetical protein
MGSEVILPVYVDRSDGAAVIPIEIGWPLVRQLLI